MEGDALVGGLFFFFFHSFFFFFFFFFHISFIGAPKKKPRKVYVCRKCGEPKRGHQCPIPDVDEDDRALNATAALLHDNRGRKKSASFTAALASGMSSAVNTPAVSLKNVPSSHYFTPQGFAAVAAIQSAAAADDLLSSSVQSTGAPLKSQRQARLQQNRDSVEQLHRQQEHYEMYQRQQRQLHHQQQMAMQQQQQQQQQHQQQQQARKQARQNQQQQQQHQQHHQHQQKQQQHQQQLQQFPQQKTGLPDLSSLLQEMGLPPVSDGAHNNVPELDPLPLRSGQLRHPQHQQKQKLQHQQQQQHQQQHQQHQQQQQQQTNNDDDDADGEVAAFTKYFSGDPSTIW
jgi:hypothetical protein